MALAANASRLMRGRSKLISFPVGDAVIIYKGGLVMLDATGFAEPASDSVALNVIGIAAEGADNALGADGAIWCEVECDAEWLICCTSITQAMVGTLMVVVDDDEVDDIVGATNDRPVGILTEYVSATEGWVYVPGVTGRLA